MKDTYFSASYFGAFNIIGSNKLIKSISIIALFIGMKVTKTTTSFFIFLKLKIISDIMIFLIIIIIYDITEIFDWLFFFGHINTNS